MIKTREKMIVDTIAVPGMNIPVITASFQHATNDKTPLLDVIADHHDDIIGSLHQYGAVLFRGFACRDADYFSQAIELCGLGKRGSTKDYDLARTLLPNDIYTSSDLPPDIPLPLHHEKPRSENPPNHIYFCCVTPAEKGGGTIFANAQAIWQDIPKPVQEKVMSHGVLYRQFFHGQSMRRYLLKKLLNDKSVRSWSDYFGSDDKITIEERLTGEKVRWDWLNHGKDLVVLIHLPGARKHPVTRQMVWFNSSDYLNFYANALYGDINALRSWKYLATRYLITNDMLPMVCHYGNGQPFTADDITTIQRVIRQHTSVLFWEEGDFMIVDNFTFIHGKQPHEGHRLLYSCMTHA
ncbi:TauD/TfdA family dioxygenase [Legionella spiritensis]|uniref:TauD/TfdA family dioxygenase n=1 Tax=Legionella spiritensis TaxID=452 RepID=UPI000F700D5A|nr:TauD/TfdA family dioxygenase [Legionella spiritensis]VEG91820.1 regulatory protein, SyrP-like protein [Legionella spiritensis]